MEISEIIQIVTSGLLGIFVGHFIVSRKNYKEMWGKYWELRRVNLELKQRNDLYEIYSPEHINEKVNEAAISHERKPTKGSR